MEIKFWTPISPSAPGGNTTIRFEIAERLVRKIENLNQLIQGHNVGALYLIRPLGLMSKSSPSNEKSFISVRSVLNVAEKIEHKLEAHDPALMRLAPGHISGQPSIPADTKVAKKLTPPGVQGRPGERPAAQKILKAENHLHSSSADSSRPDEIKTTTPTSFRALSEPKRNVLGAEIALTMILASAGIQRVRAEQARPPVVESVNNTTASHEREPKSEIHLQTAHEHVVDRLIQITLTGKVQRGPGKDSPKTARTHSSRFMVDNFKQPLKVVNHLESGKQYSGETTSVNRIKTSREANSRYTFGTEIALAAMLASGGMSRNKTEKAIIGPVSNSNQGLEQRESGGTGCGALLETTQDHAVETEIQIESIPGAEDSEKQCDFLSRIKEKLNCPEHLKTQLKSLMQILSHSPMPVYKLALDGIVSARSIPDHRVTAQEFNYAEHPARKESESLNIANQATVNKVERSARITETPGQRLPYLQRPTILVTREDTLISIAETFFHDPNLGWLIAFLNRGNSKQVEIDGRRVVTLTSRQKLTLPLFKPDVVDYYANRAGERPEEELVTIVEEIQIDRELMVTMLGPVVSGKPIDVSQKKKQLDTKTSTDLDHLQLVFED